MEPLRIEKPSSQKAVAVLFRPLKPLSGRFSVGLVVECGGVFRQAAAAVEWCGARGLLVFREVRGYARSLRLPARLSPGDVYVLRVSADFPLSISVSFHSTDAVSEDFDIETRSDPGDARTVCADPTACAISPLGEDTLAVGYCSVPAKSWRPLFHIRSLRPYPDGAVLHIPLRREKGASTARDLMIRVSVGGQRRLIIIPADRAESVASFRLKPEESGERWPVTIDAGQPLEWSGTIRRGSDALALPAFSLEQE